MKKILLITFLSFSLQASFAQDSIKKAKVYHNEFGVDVTGFIKQFFNFDQYSSAYAPTYYVTYRRHFKAGNIRFAIGGDFDTQELAPAFAQDSNKYHKSSYSFDARIGWEFTSDLGKRWQVFYGVDFKPTYAYYKNDAPYWNGGYANGTENKTAIYGIAPLLGFRIKLNERLSITTETCYAINLAITSGKRYFIPVTSQYPPQPDIVTPKAQRIYSSFSQPLSLTLTFNI